MFGVIFLHARACARKNAYFSRVLALCPLPRAEKCSDNSSFNFLEFSAISP